MTEENAQETSSGGQEAVQKPSDRIEPILAHFKVVEANVDLDPIRTHFDQLWEYENGDELEPEEQYLTTVGLFIYVMHLALEDYNINVKRAREYITETLREWHR